MKNPNPLINPLQALSLQAFSLNNVLFKLVDPEITDFFSFTETQSRTRYAEQKTTCVALHKCINQVIDDLSSAAAVHSNTLVNDVPPAMMVSTDKNVLSKLVATLLDAIMMNSQGNTIHITAKLFGSITLIHIRNSQAKYNGCIGTVIQQMQPLVDALRGCLTVSNNKKHGLTLAFTFINH